jgi:hypothetical protein
VSRANSSLPYDHDLYFEPASGAVVIELTRLRPTKQPESQPLSVANARQRMAEAAAGKRPRRPPITVRPLPDGTFDVVDGNATLGVAVAEGWPDLPVVIVDNDMSPPALEQRPAV